MDYKNFAIEIGRSPSYFAVMKAITPKKFNYIAGLDVDFKVAYSLYIAEQAYVKDRIGQIKEALKDRRKWAPFLKENGLSPIYKTTIYSEMEGFATHEAFLKAKNIIEAYKNDN